MEFNILYVLSGLVILTVLVFVLINILNLIFSKIILKKKFVLGHYLKSSLTLVGGWLVATALSLMFFSGSGDPTFGFSSFLMTFILTFTIAGKMMSLNKRDKVLYSLFLAAIINPVWYFLLV